MGLGGLLSSFLWEKAGVVIWEFFKYSHAFDERYLSTTIYFIKSKDSNHSGVWDNVASLGTGYGLQPL